MKKKMKGILSALLICFLTAGLFSPLVYASEAEDAEVQAVIEQLEAIDSLQTMQNKRSSYAVKYRYDKGGSSSIAASHEKARTGYETYVSDMFAMRLAAQQAYDALSDEQKAQIDASLVAKLDNELSTVFHSATYPVTPRNDEYSFEAVNSDTAMSYEVSHHMVQVGSKQGVTQTFVLLNTADGKTSWTPDGEYVCGESNYEVLYCSDLFTTLEAGTDYRRINLEDSSYYGEEAAKHIRGILLNSYPYVTLNEMKANLKANGMDAEFVDSLTRSDIIAAVQMAVWAYSNAYEGGRDYLGYLASIDITINNNNYYSVLHDTNNESWDWYPGATLRSYDARAEYRVNNLAYYLCSLPGVEPAEDEIVISDVKVARADLIPGSDDTYRVGMYVYLNEAGSAGDHLKIYATSYDADGNVTGKSNMTVNDQSEYQLSVKAKYGDTIKVVIEGSQYVGKGVYFYEAEGGRDASQNLVGVGEGTTRVRAEEVFTFDADTDMGLRIYKTEAETGLPLSDITFDVYKAEPAEGESLSEVPTEEEIAKFATEANKAGTVVTDETGYAVLGLEKGTYLVVEQHNAEKVKAPVAPFYVVISEEENIVSVYPKNEPVTPPEEPPIIPPTPDEVKGDFTIIKHDSNSTEVVLQGAEFAVYRPATESDENTEIIECDGIKYAVVPVLVDGEPLVLVTDENGKASSPELASGRYYLVETKAPDGYDLLVDAVAVMASSNVEEDAVFYIANEKGMLLPETGGIGTTGLMTTGGIMMLAAGILFVTKRRMRDFA